MDGRGEPLTRERGGAGRRPVSPIPAGLPRALVAQPCPAPCSTARTFLAASLARRRRWGREGARSLEVGAGLEGQALGTSLGAPAQGCPTPGSQPLHPGAVWGGGLLWIQWTPCARGPWPLLLRLPGHRWRVCGSRGAARAALSSPNWGTIYLKCTNLECLLTNFARV